MQQDKIKTAFKGVVICFWGLVLSIVSVITSNSIVLIGDLLNSTLEFISITITWLTYRVVKEDNTGDFNYGLGKIESISSLFIGLFILVSIAVMTALISYRFMHPQFIRGFGIWIGVICTAVFGLLNGRLLLNSLKQRKEEPSPIIESQCRLFGIKTFANTLMFFSFTTGLAWRGHRFAGYLDPSVSIVITLFLAYNAYHALKNSIRQLLDRAMEEPLQLLINKYLTKYFEQYRMFYKVRSRYSGQQLFIEIFLEFLPDMKMGEVQSIINSMSMDIENNIRNSRVLIIPSDETHIKRLSGRID